MAIIIAETNPSFKLKGRDFYIQNDYTLIIVVGQTQDCIELEENVYLISVNYARKLVKENREENSYA